MNPYALVALDVACRETGYTDTEIMGLMAGDDVEIHGVTDGLNHFVYRHSVDKLKARATSIRGAL